jgi:hypothetical protein
MDRGGYRRPEQQNCEPESNAIDTNESQEEKRPSLKIERDAANELREAQSQKMRSLQVVISANLDQMKSTQVPCRKKSTIHESFSLNQEDGLTSDDIGDGHSLPIAMIASRHESDGANGPTIIKPPFTNNCN